MDPEIRPFEDLSETGLLWLINRQVFHPRGFAFALAMDAHGKAVGWQLVGDGIEPWNFPDGHENELLAAANETLAPQYDEDLDDYDDEG